MLDVVGEVFIRSGRTKTKHRKRKNKSLYMVPEALILHEVHKMTKYGIAGQTRNVKKMTLLPQFKLTLLPHIANEPCVFSEIKSINPSFMLLYIHLCGN